MTTALAQLEQAERLLAGVQTPFHAVNVTRVAEVAREYAKRLRLGVSCSNYATRIKVLAERRLAELVDAGQAAGEVSSHGGDRKSRSAPRTLMLDDLGVDKRRLAEARVLARATPGRTSNAE